MIKYILIIFVFALCMETLVSCGSSERMERQHLMMPDIKDSKRNSKFKGNPKSYRK